MDFFVFLLLLFALGSLVLSSLSFAMYPIVSIDLRATNPLTSLAALAATISWDPLRDRGRSPDNLDGDVTALALQGTDIGLSPLPQLWLGSAAKECVHDTLLFSLFVTALTVVSVNTVVALLLAWSTPSAGDIQDMKKRLARFAADDALDNAADPDFQGQQQQLDDDDDGKNPRVKYVRRADTKFRVSKYCQRIVYGSAGLVLCFSLLCSAFVFTTRRCIEKELIAYFREESVRTRFTYAASSTSWPGFLMCFSAVAAFCSLIAVVHWVGFQHYGPKIFENVAAVEMEGLAHGRGYAVGPSLMLSDFDSPGAMMSSKRSARQVSIVPPPAQPHRELYNL